MNKKELFEIALKAKDEQKAKHYEDWIKYLTNGIKEGEDKAGKIKMESALMDGLIAAVDIAVTTSTASVLNTLIEAQIIKLDD